VLPQVAVPDSDVAPIGAAVASLVPAWLSLALSAAADRGWGQEDVQSLRASQNDPPLGQQRGCVFDGVVAFDSPDRCVFETPGARGRIVLVGDSHANSLSTAVVEASRQLRRHAHVVTASSCVFSRLAGRTTRRVPNCGGLYEEMVRRLTAAPRADLLVITHSGAAHVDQLASEGDTAALETWTDSLAAALYRVSAAGVPVLLVLDIPRIGETSTICRFGAVIPVDCTVPRSGVDQRLGRVRLAETELASRLPRVSSLDLTGEFCDQRECRANLAQTLLYSDSHHLNLHGGRHVTQRLQAAMARALSSRYE